jgi:putative hydrolase of the HAD superfamily
MLGLNAFPAFEPFQAGQIGLNEFLTDLRLFLQLGSNESALAVHLGILKEPYPGTLEFVEELHRTGIRTACLSNTNAPHWDKMREFSLYPAIASIEFPFVSHELGMDKPGREIYDSLNTSTGFSGSELVFFDDTPVNVSAAIELEWQAFVIDPFGDPVQQMRELLSNSAVA